MENQKIIRSLALSEQSRRRSVSGTLEEEATEKTNMWDNNEQHAQRSSQASLQRRLGDSKHKSQQNLHQRPLSLTVDTDIANETERTEVESPRLRSDKGRVRSAGAIRSGSSTMHARPSTFLDL